MSLKPAWQLILPGTVTPNLLGFGGVIPITAAAHTVARADNQNTLYFSNVGGTTITLPNHNTLPNLEVGFSVDWVQGVGAEALTFQTESGDTKLYYSPSAAEFCFTPGVGASGTIRLVDVDGTARTWLITGGLV